MKKLFFFLALTGGFTAMSQTVINLDEREKPQELIDSLAVFYTPALTADSTTGIMSARFTEFETEFTEWRFDMSAYLNEQNFFWNGPTKLTLNVYAKEGGEIDFVLYQFVNGSMDEQSYFSFGPLLEKYVQEYNIPLNEKASQPFSQCGPVVMMDSDY